jgi:Mn2+/Fe2+ NRAMP family transporter
MDTSNQTEQMIDEAHAKGLGATILTYVKLSGPGWMQSAITLGGGSLGGALFLGVIGGYSMLWVQVVAMILGVIMLSAISYVTLSTGESPFQGIRKHINPVLAWGWLIASLMANMVWVLPQYSLAYAALTQNIAPDLVKDPSLWQSKFIVSLVIFGVVTAITMQYGSKGIGIKIYEWALKIVVAFIVLSFFGVVISLRSDLPWGEIFKGFFPNFGLINHPTAKVQSLLDMIQDETARAYWTSQVLTIQRDVMVAAAATAVGINMTFLLPFSLLAKKWTRKFRGLAVFDLSTGMVVPFVLATGCVVIASTAMFHTKEFDGLLVQEDGALVVSKTADAGAVKNYSSLMAGRETFNEGALAEVTVSEQEMRMAAVLIKRDNAQFANALTSVTANAKVSQKIFGLGVLAMTMSTISLLMLISGYCVCEAFGFPHGGMAHKLGTLCASTGLLWPWLWSGTSKAYLVVPTSVFGFVLLPIAFVTFLFMMNSKRLLGDDKPKGSKLVTWNILMGLAVLITGVCAISKAWTVKIALFGKDVPAGQIWVIGFTLMAVMGHVWLRRKHTTQGAS